MQWQIPCHQAKGKLHLLEFRPDKVVAAAAGLGWARHVWASQWRWRRPCGVGTAQRERKCRWSVFWMSWPAPIRFCLNPPASWQRRTVCKTFGAGVGERFESWNFKVKRVLHCLSKVERIVWIDCIFVKPDQLILPWKIILSHFWWRT